MELDSSQLIYDEQTLSEMYGPALERSVRKQLNHLDEYCRAYIAASPLLMLATMSQGSEPWRLDPITLETVATSGDLPAGPTWPGGIAVAADGSIVISYIDGYDTAQMRIGVAVRGPSGPWRTSFLSAEGSSQVARVAAGPDGTVAVGWTTPVLGADTVRLATLDASAGSARWAKRTVVSGIVAGDPTPVVEPSGAVLIIYSDSSVSGRFLASRRLLHGSLGAVRQLTATGEFTEVGAVAVTGRGRVLVGHRQLDFGLGQLGLFVVPVVRGVPGPDAPALLDASPAGAIGRFSMGTGPRGLVRVIYQRGTYPTTDFAWLERR